MAQGYVALAYRMGIIKGVSAYNFEPKKEATREQAAAVLLRTYDRLHAAIKVTEAADGSAPSGCVTAGSHHGGVRQRARSVRARRWRRSTRRRSGRARAAAWRCAPCRCCR